MLPFLFKCVNFDGIPGKPMGGAFRKKLVVQNATSADSYPCKNLANKNLSAKKSSNLIAL